MTDYVNYVSYHADTTELEGTWYKVSDTLYLKLDEPNKGTGVAYVNACYNLYMWYFLFGGKNYYSAYQGQPILTDNEFWKDSKSEGILCPNADYIVGAFGEGPAPISSSSSSSISSSSSSYVDEWSSSSGSQPSSSSSSSSSSSTYVKSSSSSSGDNCCTNRICSGTICDMFINWILNGTKLSNTNNCSLSVQASWSGTTATVIVSNGAGQVASGTGGEGAGTINLTQQNSSGISGTVYKYSGTFGSVLTGTISCADASSSSTSSSISSSSSSSSSSLSMSSMSSSSSSSSSSMSSDSSFEFSESSSSSTENVFELYGFLNCDINGSTTHIYWVELYSHINIGVPCDRDFWGEVANYPSGLVLAGYISQTINGTTYWLRVYTAREGINCCTNLEGTWRPV